MTLQEEKTPLLSVKGLTTSLLMEGISRPVVKNLYLDLFPGETLALVGESGCGKSMTALSIMRILPEPIALPPKGEILYKGRNLLALSEKEMRKLRGATLSMIFQDPMNALNPVYTIGSQLLEVVRTHLNVHGPEAEERVHHALERVKLEEPHLRMEEYPHQMSGGMLQRAMIAMALLCEPDVLIADEPTTALDVTIQAQILDLLKELMESSKMAMLLITHDMGVVAEMADKVAVMYASEKVEEASVHTLFDFPAHPYTQGLFSSRITHKVTEGKFGCIKGSVPPLSKLPSGCHFHPRCPYALEVCKQGEVPPFPLPTENHEAKCWLYDRNLEEKLTDEEKQIVSP